MASFFDERERAAEYGFVHAEELRFLAARRGVETLGIWAAQRMRMADPATYAAGLVEAMTGGAGEAAVLARVIADLQRAGQADIGNEAGAVLSRATAEAHGKLHDIVSAPN